MASILKVDDLRGNTAAGNITITSEGGSATMQLQQGVAKVWANFEQIGTHELRDSVNVSSLTDNGTGRTEPLSFTNNMGNANFAGTIFQSGATGTNMTDFNNVYVGGLGSKTTSGVGLGGHNNAGFLDVEMFDVVIQGDLA